MTSDEARVIATDELERAKELNASHEHAESAKRAKLASVILDLCYQLEERQRPITTAEAERKLAKAKK
jgi:hypothetical protein